MTINPAEHAICKQRGHHREGIAQMWMQCKWCGVWHRTIQTLQEREDDPPTAEQDNFQKLNTIHAELKELLP